MTPPGPLGQPQAPLSPLPAPPRPRSHFFSSGGCALLMASPQRRCRSRRVLTSSRRPLSQSEPLPSSHHPSRLAGSQSERSKGARMRAGSGPARAQAAAPCSTCVGTRSSAAPRGLHCMHCALHAQHSTHTKLHAHRVARPAQHTHHTACTAHCTPSTAEHTHRTACTPHCTHTHINCMHTTLHIYCITHTTLHAHCIACPL